MSEETPKKKVAVLHHSDLDGFGSAYSIWKALKDTCELLFIPVQYGQEPPCEALTAFSPEDLYIVDFSYDMNILEKLAETYKVVVLDHHQSAADKLGVSHWQKNLHIMVDVTQSGCVLTWKHFFELNDGEGAEPIPELLLYVQDRDLWKFELEHSKEINAFIATMDEDFEVWDDFYTPEAYDCGRAILKFQGEQIKRRLKDVVISDLTTYGPLKIYTSIPFVNASENQSELGEAMCFAYPDAPFSVSYCDRADGSRSYSLRSRNGFDVSEVCKAFGGGGHPGAGGFTLPAPEII